MRIGELSASTGASLRSLRYYEQQGLLTASRTSSGQRVYPAETADRVRYIQKLIAAGLGTRTIRDIIPCYDSGHADAGMIERMLEERDRIEERLVELAQTKAALDRVILVAHEYVAGESAA
jgi:DNA-binding transcriptional MerR regulator